MWKHSFSECLYVGICFGGWNKWERTGLPRCVWTDIVESQAAGRCVIWAQYFANDSSAFSQNLPFSFLCSGCAMEGMLHLAWLKMWQARDNRKHHWGGAFTQQRQTNRSQSFPPVSCGWRTLTHFSFFSGLSCRLQWSCPARPPRQDPATSPSSCSYGNLFEPSGSNFLSFIFPFNVNFYVVWSNRPKHCHTRLENWGSRCRCLREVGLGQPTWHGTLYSRFYGADSRWRMCCPRVVLVRRLSAACLKTGLCILGLQNGNCLLLCGLQEGFCTV